uniref:Reverse transcriptase domain-containing protein n=1 Tax=Tanacetum cinerariifolium TaxID=118510 RepID=A0A6L2L6L0_TANCI|nr:reverse transcriptase domain-containing protein [Tanacetum cinerariifolium]
MRKLDRKHSFRKREKENARREKKFKGLVNVRSDRMDFPHNKKGLDTVGMVRGKGYMKRPYEKIEKWMDNEISFPSVPRYRLVDSFIILEAYIEGFQVRRIYVDGGSFLEVMYEHCFRNLGSDTRAKPRESRVPLVGFSSEVNYPLGIIDLSVTTGELDRVGTVIMEFAVVKCHSPNNVILGRSGMRSLGAVASTIHSMIKFSTTNEIATMTRSRNVQTKKTFAEQRPHKKLFVINKLIAAPATLNALMKDEELMVYLSTADEAVSVVLLVERNGRQMPIHYLSRSLQGVEVNYSLMEKLALALVHADIRLRRYFQGHAIKVATDKEINRILNIPEASGRLAKIVKGQGGTNNSGPRGRGRCMEFVYRRSLQRSWIRSKTHLNRLGRHVKYYYALRLNFNNSNNDIEYEALLTGLKIAKGMKVKNIHTFVDLKLVASKVEGSYEVRGEKTNKYKEKVLEVDESLCIDLGYGVLSLLDTAYCSSILRGF